MLFKFKKLNVLAFALMLGLVAFLMTRACVFESNSLQLILFVIAISILCYALPFFYRTHLDGEVCEKEKFFRDQIRSIDADLMLLLSKHCPSLDDENDPFSEKIVAYIKADILSGRHRDFSQRIVDSALKTKARRLQEDINRQQNLRFLVERSKSNDDSNVSAKELNNLIEGKERVDKTVQGTKNVFRKLHALVSELGFRTWPEYWMYRIYNMQ